MENVIARYLYCVLMLVKKVNKMVYFITLSFHEKILVNSYEGTFLNVKMATLIMRKCVVFVICDNVKVQKFTVCLLAVVLVVQYFKI